MLVLVPTPIGNLEDISLRALRELKEADLILAEDTRHTRILLKRYDIDTPTRSYHSHNEHKILQKLIIDLKNNRRIVLVSDAGTPGISDPGFLLVRACHENQIPVTALPGATAFVPALVMSGLPSDRFYFEGFLPHKKGRRSRLEFLKTLDCTVIFYESPHRIVKTLLQLMEFFDENSEICLVKEISKIHEKIYCGTLKKVAEDFVLKTGLKGEFVVVLSPAKFK